MLQHPQMNMFKKILNTIYYHHEKIKGGDGYFLVAVTFFLQLFGLGGLLFWVFNLFPGVSDLIWIVGCVVVYIPILILWHRYTKKYGEEILMNKEAYGGIGKRILTIIYIIFSYYWFVIELMVAGYSGNLRPY